MSLAGYCVSRFSIYKSFTIILIGSLALTVNYYTYINDFNGPPIRSDGFGYYIYLPGLLIHSDPAFRFIDSAPSWSALSQYPLDELAWTGLREGVNGYVQKYPVGVALMQLPFFVVAWLAGGALYADPSGFKPAFQYANIVSGIFYLCAGLILLLETLCRMVSVLLAFVLIIFATLGTNLLLYGSYDASFAHVYCFFAGALVTWLVFGPRELLKPAVYYFLLGAAVGLATIVRPTNLIWCLAIFVSPPRDLRAIAVAALAFAAGLLVLASPQIAYWAIATGQPVTYSYGDEGFNFLAPELANYLFSVRKGVFFWHPAYLLLLVAAIWAMAKGCRDALLPIAIFAVASYVNASWWAWPFGARPAVDTLPFLVAGAGMALADWRPSVRAGAILSIPLALLVVVNLVQMHGYVVHRIGFDGTTWAEYVAFWNGALSFL